MKQFVVVVLFLLLCAAVFLMFNISPRQISLKDIEPVETVAEDPAPVKHEVADASMLPVESKDSTVGKENSVVQDPKPVPEPVAAIQENKPPENDAKAYYIIIEGFKNSNAAKERAETLSKKFNAEMFVLPPTHAGIYRISYGKYSTYEQAETALIRVKIKIRPEAWILSPKK
jgi:cell division septation protein DedD